MENALLNQDAQLTNSHTMLFAFLHAQAEHSPAMEDVSEAAQLDHSTSETGAMTLAQSKQNTLPITLVLLLAQQVLHLSIMSVPPLYDLTFITLIIFYLSSFFTFYQIYSLILFFKLLKCRDIVDKIF